MTFLICFVSSVVMDTFMETVNFCEKAENTLRDISQTVCHGSDVVPRHYISVLKDCLARIKVLKVWCCFLFCLSHTGMVVPQCIKDDSISQWKSGKFDPRSLQNP